MDISHNCIGKDDSIRTHKARISFIHFQFVLFSDGKGFDLIGNRQQIDVDGQPFVKARIEIGLPYEFGHGLRLIQNFEIDEIISDAFLGTI